MTVPALTLKRCMAYACGMMGWSILINLIGVILVYLYLPPQTSGLPNLITQVAVFGILNVVSLITAAGRLIDAIYDPFIAQFSDASTHPKGRRIPIMKWAIVPSVLFCCLVFYPITKTESVANIWWLVFTLIGFYVATTTYIIPYNALLPQLAKSSAEKVKLATWQSLGYVFGIGIASNAFNLATFLQNDFGVESKLQALQYTVFTLSLLAGLMLSITVFGIDERLFGKAEVHAVSLKIALRATLRNSNFLYFIVADFAYFMSVTLITSGLMYFVTVLLQLPESIGNKLMITMVLVSFIFYPITNKGAARVGKKKIVIASLVLLAAIFLGVFYLGKFSLDGQLQIYILIALAAVPMASLNILPNAILAEIIEKDSLETGQNKEAVYFAVRYFFVKIAQTLGIALFAMFLIYGKDVGNDFGIRLNGIIGCVLCSTAALLFSRFKEVE